MIFSRFFTPSHASRDPQKRIKAIAELSPQKTKERTALHELAFNDSESEVSLAALEKLNSFPLWLKMSQTAKDARIQRRANQQVELIILDPQSQVVSSEELAEFLLKQAPVELVKKVLLSEKVNVLDQDAVLALLDKTGNQAFLTRFFNTHSNDSVKMALVGRTTDDSLLFKWQKKADSPNVRQAIENRILILKEAREKPVETEKKATLLLSKLQALTERFDYQEVLARRKDSESEFEVLQADFAVLSKDVRQSLEDKYQQLKGKVDGHEERLRKEWEAKALEQQTEIEWKKLRKDTGEVCKEVEWLFSERLSDATLADVSAVNDKTRDLEERITAFSSQQVSQFLRIEQQISNLNQRLARFNEQQQAGQRLLKILTQAETALGEHEQHFIEKQWNETKSNWQHELAALDVVPASYQKRWSEIVSKVKGLTTEQRVNEQKAAKEARRLLSTVSNLYESGRYRPAIARFNELTAAMEALPASVNQQLARRYDTLAESITRLANWQADIAAPKKPALLAEAQALADAEADNIPDRAQAIKLLRKQWQSLTIPGDDDPDKDAFDVALEKAFAPCRAFYAAQEHEREQNAKTRQTFIDEMEKAASSITEPAELAKVSEKLKQQWREAGSVEQSVYEVLRERWNNAAAQVSTIVSDWHAENRKLKKGIIEKAKALVDETESVDTVEKAKLLQQEWKTIGSAGRRHDTKLWQLFKETNDTLFQQVKKYRNDESAKQNDQVDALLSDVKSIAAQSISSDEALDVALAPIFDTLSTLPKNKQGVIQQRISKLKKAVKAKQDAARIDSKKSLIQGLVSLLGVYDSEQGWNKSSEAWESLPKAWRDLLSSKTSASANGRSSEWYLTQCEILADIPSPEGSNRTEVQMAMMTDKLQHGEDANLVDSVKAWFSELPIKSSEVPRMAKLLDRIENDVSLLERFAK